MKKKFILLNIILTCIFMFNMLVSADNLENDVKVKEDSDLIYYLTVDYDGVDENANVSSDNATLNILSDYIEVTDKLPQGLAYKGIVETESGTIGAIKRSDRSLCSGYVVDGINGIRYDSNTHAISFKIKNLQAGCKITVGVIVTTPTSVNGRMDFYNSFNAFENNLSKISNQVHVYMGSDSVSTYKVTYEYTGDIPQDVPNLPDEMLYASGSNVSVLGNINLLGYDFSGWDSSDVEVNNGIFTMPDKDVTFKGSFSKKNKYQVKYEIEGDIPKSYIIPKMKEYYENTNVSIDTLKAGDIVNGYKFLGWSTKDIEINDDVFIMPNKNVIFKGKFERISYKVSYAYQGQVVPPGATVPETKEYYPGEKVKLESPKDVNGYNFLGWYSKDNFTMPEEDVIIYGEWIVSKGLFEPKITKEIINKSDEYRLGEEVKFKIVVTNTAEFDIKNVIVKENNNLSKFSENDDYILNSEHVITIPIIKAGESIIVYAKYIVTEDSLKIENNEVEILGATSDEYHLNTEKEYKASVEFKTNNRDVIVPNTLKGISIISIIIGSIIIFMGIIIYKKNRKII